MFSSNFAIATLLVIHFALTFFLLWLLFRICRRVIKRFVKYSRERSEGFVSWPDLLIAAGLVAILFRGKINAMVFKLGDFFMYTFDGAQGIASHWNTTADGASEATQGSSVLSDYLMGLQASFTRNIIDLDFGLLIFIVALFILLTNLITTIRLGGHPSQAGNHPVLRNILVFAITVFSIFLCTASIVAVPEFEKLHVMQDEADLVVEFEQGLQEQKLYRSNALYITQDSFRKKPNIPVLDSLLDELRNLETGYNSLLKTFESVDVKNAKDALESFKLSAGQRIGEKEIKTYQQRLTSWFSSYHVKWVLPVQTHRANLVSYANRMNAVISAQVNSPLSSLGDDNFETHVVELSNLQNAQTLLNTFRPSPTVMPARPTIGENHGEFFIKATGWLLRTESESLAIIVGMFGFGLFGSIGSFFIRRRSKTGADEQPEIDSVFSIADILLNGMSAAIVVFLGVKGAVMVFTTNNSVLNPYALFFTCLIAAVFSEDVWKWARKKLLENLGDTQ